MSRYKTSFRIEGPFAVSDPISELVKFYKTNGFSLQDSTEAPLPEGVEIEERHERVAKAAEKPDGIEASPEVSSETENTEDQDEDEENPGSKDDDSSDEKTREDPDKLEDEVGPEEPTQDVEGDDEDEDESTPEGEADSDATIEARMTRGKKKASIWSSNMADLHALLGIRYDTGAIVIDYDVEITLQHLTEDDKRFWTREAAKAEAYIQGKVDAVIDWRENESIRVDQQQRDIIMFGVQMMIVAAILVAIIYFSIN